MHNFVAFSKPDKLFTPIKVIVYNSKTIAKDKGLISILSSTTLGLLGSSFPNLELRIALTPKLIPILKLTLGITYIETNLQKLLKIYVNTKKLPQKS